MGTNFYFKTSKKHIGKRSAAGLYCWDCGITLCKQGNKGIHYDSKWHDVCPKCGKAPHAEPLTDSSAGRELGLNTNKPKKKTGVTTCCSFTWAVEPGYLADRRKHIKILDEYNREFTKEEFMQVLEECPVQFRHFIGQEFS